MSSIALVDCNNFFVSCERVFNPKLHNRPVVVLSSNDGCIIARSQEAKALGIPMGAPLFKWADFLRTHDVITCSSNFALYGDLSHRVMETLAHFNPDLEIYSVDEAFLFLEGIADPTAHCRHIRRKVLQWTGIPVSIGIAPSKTLAKIANYKVKRDPSLEGVYNPSAAEFDAILDPLVVNDVWGIGGRLSKFLAKQGIHTAKQLRDQEDLWIKKHLSVVGLRTVMELRGISCLPLDEAPAPRQTLMTSRSFGRPIDSKEELFEAVATYGARGAEKLREEGSLASWLQVFITTSPHKEGYYANQAHAILPQPTDYTPQILTYAHAALDAIFRPGHLYKKAGILLGGIVPKGRFQPDLFIEQDLEKEEKQKALMALLDHANETFGYKILQFASEGIEKPWQTQKELRSPCYTTQWDELLTISI